MKSLKKFEGKHCGGRCWIVGNGPSLRQMDLSLFRDEIVFASNAIFLLFPEIAWRPRYYSCVDTRVLPDIANEIAKMLKEHPQIIAFFPEELPQYDGTGCVLKTSSLLPTLPNIHFFQQKPMVRKNLPSSAFTIGSGRILCSPKTVTVGLMQLAVIMGFSEIYLIGCDTAYTIPATVVQSGGLVNGTPGERLLLTSTADDDPNHFTSNYFGVGKKWHHPKVDQIIKHYSLAKDVLDSAGVAVFNATVGGKLDVFPRIDYREVLLSE